MGYHSRTRRACTSCRADSRQGGLRKHRLAGDRARLIIAVWPCFILFFFAFTPGYNACLFAMASFLFALFFYLYVCAAAVLPLDSDVFARSVPKSLNHDLNARWWTSPSLGVNLINGTPWKWKLKKAVGKLPATVEPFSVVSLASCGSDDTATYVIDTNGSPSFDIDLESHQVKLTSMSTLGNPVGSTIRLGRDDSGDDYVNWVLAGNDTSKLSALSPFSHFSFANDKKVSTNPPRNWIQSVLPTFGNTPLNQFILPGSHDAGSEYTGLAQIATSRPNRLLTWFPISGVPRPWYTRKQGVQHVDPDRHNPRSVGDR